MIKTTNKKIKKAGLIKLFLPLEFNSDAQSTGYNTETLYTMTALADNVAVLSANDMSCGQNKKVLDTTFINYNNNVNTKLDYSDVFVFNSKNSINISDDRNTQRLYNNEVNKYLDMCKTLKDAKINIHYVVTDYALTDTRFKDIADKMFSQATTGEHGIHLPIYENVLFDNFFSTDKITSAVYIGNCRDRKAKMHKYLTTDKIKVFGSGYPKSFLNYMPERIPFDECKKVLAKTKSTIILADVDYERLGWITPRYYEALASNVVAFMDVDSPIAKTMRSNDYRIVKTKQELETKITTVDKNEKLRQQLIFEQSKELKKVKETYNLRMLEGFLHGN